MKELIFARLSDQFCEEFVSECIAKKNVCQINCVEFSHAMREWMLIENSMNVGKFER